MGPHGLERRFDRFRRNGDPAALAAVFDATAPEILKVAAHLVRDPAAAEDLLQRTFLTAIEVAPTWDRSRRLLPWLLGILTNHAKEESRRAARTPDPARLTPHETEDPFAAASRREAESAAGLAIDELPDPARSILVLRYRHGLEPAEIALALGIPPATVRSHLHRGTDRVRRRVPHGLAVVAGFDLPTRGIAEIRRVVVARATVVGATIAASAGGGAATTGVVSGGVRVGRWIFAGAAGFLLLAGGVSYLLLGRDAGGAGPVPDRPAAALDVEARNSEPPTLAGAAERRTLNQAAAVPAAKGATRGSLEVLFLARDGKPLPDEPFAFQPFEDPGPTGYRAGRAGADGRGRLDGLDPGAGQVSGGHGQGRYVEITAGGVTQVEIRLSRGVDIEGVVVDPLGAPVVGADLIVMGMFGWPGGRGTTRTSADGHFSVEDVTPNAVLWARAPGYAPSPRRELGLGEGKTETLRLVLGGAGASVRGRVEDANRSPVAGALVAIQPFGAAAIGVPGGTYGLAAPGLLTWTDDDGTFAADGLLAGRTSIAVRARGQGAYLAVRELVAGPTPNDLPIALVAGVAVEGVVVDEAGSPAAHADVWIDTHWGRAWCWWTRTDALGRFRFDPELGEQAASLRALKTGRPEALQGVATASRLAPVVRIVIKPFPRIRIRVIDERGDPIAGRLVRATSGRPQTVVDPGATATERTDSDGRATLYVGEGTYELAVMGPEGSGDRPVAQLRNVLPGADETTLTVRDHSLPTARIVVRLTFPDGQLPAGTSVWAGRPGGLGVESLSPNPAGGQFETKLIPPGRYSVGVSRPGMGNTPLGRVRVAAGQTLDLGEIRVEPPGSLVVTLHGVEAVARPLGWIVLRSARGGAGSQLGPDGTARFVALAPGAYDVVFPFSTGVASGSVVIESGREASLDLTAVPGHACRIRVEGVGAADVLGLTIDVHAEGADAVVLSTRFLAYTPDGLSELAGALAPGRYVAEAETEDGRKASVTFEVRGDGEPPVVITGFK